MMLKYVATLIGLVLGAAGFGFALSDMKSQPDTVQPYFPYQFDALMIGLFGSIMVASLLYLIKKIDEKKE